MCPIFPCAGAGALTHCEGSRPTPHTIYACVRVLGVRCWGLALSVEGIGCVMREWRDEVRLGIIKLLSCWSRVPGRSPFPVRGRWNDEWVFRDGAILTFGNGTVRALISCRVLGDVGGCGMAEKWCRSTTLNTPALEMLFKSSRFDTERSLCERDFPDPPAGRLSRVVIIASACGLRRELGSRVLTKVTKI